MRIVAVCMLAVIGTIILMSVPVPVHSANVTTRWGAVGHKILAQIAQGMLTAKASQQIGTLIPGGDMGAIASWADDVRNTPEYRWSAPLHFVNTPDWLCNYQKPRDCQEDWCCDGAIQNFTRRLADTALPMTQRTEALKFLVHFIGDIHQPLHVGFTTDLGGNTIKGTYNGASTNLHSMWDSGLIYYRIDNFFGKDNDKWRQSLVNRIHGEWSQNVNVWKQCQTPPYPSGACSTDWAEESIAAACKWSYVDETGQHIKSGFKLALPYFTHVIDALEMQVAKGGVRLSNVLNLLFA